MVGLVVLIVGFGILITQSAFRNTLKTQKRTTYTFHYTGTSFSVADVEDESKWEYDPAANTCSGDEQACTIRISGEYVDNSTSSPKLKSLANLSATLNPLSNTAYITNSSDDSMQIFNTDNF